MDYANAVGIEPVITLAYDINTVTDWADLVEYCWGDATTTYGSLRINEDAHPAPYNVSVWELGNEQYNIYWCARVRVRVRVRWCACLWSDSPPPAHARAGWTRWRRWRPGRRRSARRRSGTCSR